MIGNPKALALALAAVFAFSAAAAASASAETSAVITTDGTSVRLSGDEITGAIENFFEFGGRRVECHGDDLPGTEVGSSLNPVPAGASEITIVPTYTNCEEDNGVPTAVDMNGCDYILRDATTTGGVAGTYGVKVKILCPTVEGVKQKIRLTTAICNILIGEQEVSGFHLTNEPGGLTLPDDFILSGEAAISATACGIPVTAAQHQNVEFTGRNSTNQRTELTLSHN